MGPARALRPCSAVCGSVIAFALLIERAGFPIAVLFTVLIASTGTPRLRHRTAFLLAVLVAAAMTFVFAVLLDQPFVLIPRF